MKNAIYLVGQGTYFRPRPIEVQFHRILRFTELASQDAVFDVSTLFLDLSPRVWREHLPNFETEYPGFLNLLKKVKQGEVRTIHVDFDTSTANQMAGLLLNMEELLTRSGGEVINCFWKTIDYHQEHAHGYFSGRGDASDFIAFFPNFTADICHLVLQNLEIYPGKDSDLEKLRHRIHHLGEEKAGRGTGNNWPLFPWWLDKRYARRA